jgi:nicotinamide-nucleotide amidase
MPESVVGEKLAGIESAFGGLTIGYRAHFPEIEVKVLARAKDKPEAHDIATRAAADVRSRLADVLYGEGEDTFPGVVGRALRTRGWTLAVAESCTGGLVGHLLTREAGASDYFLLDAVTYANSAKQQVLGVDEDALRGHGAVSAEVASGMAEGARRVSGADVALAITGIAGPTGGTETKPVGLVYLAVSTPKGTVVKERTFQYADRTMIQTIAAYAGLALVLEAAR